MDLTKSQVLLVPCWQPLLLYPLATLLFTYFIGFRMYKSDYNAACMCAGLIGMGMGSGSNAVANERAVMEKYGYSHIAWILYPAFSVLCVDIFNPLFMSFAPGLMGFGADFSQKRRMPPSKSAASGRFACFTLHLKNAVSVSEYLKSQKH